MTIVPPPPFRSHSLSAQLCTFEAFLGVIKILVENKLDYNTHGYPVCIFCHWLISFNLLPTHLRRMKYQYLITECKEGTDK
jgi:hypothetical protein